MEFLRTFLLHLWDISLEASPFLLLGFGIASLLHAYLPTELLLRLLGKGKIRPTVTAAFIGIPLPLCSCSVVPTALALRKKGASPGATLSFLISTPETGVDSIVLTYGIMGPFGMILAIARPLAAGVTSILAGVLLDRFGPEDLTNSPEPPSSSSTCCSSKESDPIKDNRPEKTSEECSISSPLRLSQYSTHWRRIQNSFFQLFDEVAYLIALGLLFSALVGALLPADLGILKGSGNDLIEMSLAIAIGLPMYICATASTPLAAVLISKGLSPGAGLVFLLVGPATNLGTIALVKKILGKWAVVVYLGSITLVSVLFGLGVNSVCQEQRLDISLFSHTDTPSRLALLFAVLLWFLLIWRSIPKWGSWMRQKT